MNLIEILESCQGKTKSQREAFLRSIGVPKALWEHIHGSFDNNHKLVNQDKVRYNLELGSDSTVCKVYRTIHAILDQHGTLVADESYDSLLTKATKLAKFQRYHKLHVTFPAVSTIEQNIVLKG
jgi:hypothetical protein